MSEQKMLKPFSWKRKAVASLLCLLLILMAGVCPPVAGQETEKLFVNEIFDARGFSAEYSASVTEGGEKGLLLSGSAPASFSLKKNVGGDFDMAFAALAQQAALVLDDGKDGLTVTFRRDSGALFVGVGGEEVSLVAAPESKMNLHLSAADGQLTVATEGGDASFKVKGFSFTEYSATFLVQEGLEGSAKVYLYNINDVMLSEPMVRSAKNRLYLPVLSDGVAEDDYQIVDPVVYNAVDGISHEVRVSVQKGTEVILEEQDWEAGLSFRTQEVGTYRVWLYAGTGETAAAKSFDVVVRDSVAASEISVKEAFPFAKVGKGSCVSLPRVTFGNDLYKEYWQETQYTVSLNGKKISTEVGVEQGVMYTFEEAGTYTFDYYCAAPLLYDRYSFTVEVLEDMPAINFKRNDADRMVGDAFVLPTAELTLNGEPLESQTVLHFPSGEAILNDTTLSEEGVYTVEFRTAQEDSLTSYSYDFEVSSKLHLTEDAAEYGAWTEGYFDSPVNGLLVELSNGKSYEFGNIVDLSDNTGSNVDFLTFYVLPYQKGNADFYGLTITLTDAYNPDIYVILDFLRDTENYGEAYVKARAYNQTDLVGLQWWAADRVSVHRNNIYGYTGRLSFTGDDNINWPGGYRVLSFTLGFDNLTQYLYGIHGWDSANTVGPSNRIITRLADNTLYRDAFPGFTTGEVRVSIAGYNYNSSKGRVLITELDGQDLTQTVVHDTKGPMIDVDTGEYTEENIPRAVVGQPYPLFPATAMDARSGDVPVLRRVSLEGSKQTYDINMEDGSFTPEEEGTYLLEYVATDFFKNTTVYTVPVEAVAEAPIEVELAEPVEEAFCGEIVPVADFTCTGGSGTPKLNAVTVTDGSGAAVELTDGSFQPETAGKYTVTYEFSDYVGQTLKTDYSVAVTVSDDPVLNADPVLPLAFLDGGEYQLPLPKALDYSGGSKQEVEPEIYVTDASGRNKAEGGACTVTGETGTEATVTYIYKSAKGELEREFTVPVRKLTVGAREDQNFNVAGLIVPTNGELVTFEGNDNYFLSANSDESFFFANPLLADVFGFEFNIGYPGANGVTGSDLQQIRLTLIDSENRNERFEADIVPNPENASNSLISVNGGTQYVINGTFQRNTNYSFNVQYNGAIQSVRVGETDVLVETYSDGTEFAGFSSGKAYCQVELIGVGEGGVLVEMMSVSGQPLTSADMKDRISPSYSLTGPVPVCYTVNDSLHLPKVLVGDVLSLKSYVRISLQSPSHQIVTAADGTQLDMAEAKDYDVVLNETGTYLLTFTVWDDNGGTARAIVQSLNVFGKQAPVVTPTEESLSVNAGDDINATALFQVEDPDSDDELDICLFMMNSEGKLTAAESDGYVHIGEDGSYQIICVAYDSEGNSGRASVPVTAGGAK